MYSIHPFVPNRETPGTTVSWPPSAAGAAKTDDAMTASAAERTVSAPTLIFFSPVPKAKASKGSSGSWALVECAGEKPGRR